MRRLLFVILMFASGYSYSQFINSSFETGNTVLVKEQIELIKGKKVGIITNRTGVDKNGKHIIDLLVEAGIDVVKIYTPEHGFSADDSYTASGVTIPVVSLYGNKYSFSKSDVDDVDVIVFDIQELGARFYTYTSTLFLTMQDAKKFGKDYIVCDRPSVANINSSEGFSLDEDFSSFVGKIPTPVITGLTVGELGNFLNGEYVNHDKFRVVKMKGYTRNMKYENLMDVWINPSPSITSLESARIYPALCFLEGTNVSEGRGTETPFQVFGAPFIDKDVLLENLNVYGLEGVSFEKIEFTPNQSLLPSYTAMKYSGKKCSGLKITITDLSKFKPFRTSVAIIKALISITPEFKWTQKNFIDKLAGTDKLRKMINTGNSLDEIIEASENDARTFMKTARLYILYY
ncbi:MAG: DUF1343 domain-containing protein [Candidatus Kapaibacterium sp.]